MKVRGLAQSQSDFSLQKPRYFAAARGRESKPRWCLTMATTAEGLAMRGVRLKSKRVQRLA